MFDRPVMSLRALATGLALLTALPGAALGDEVHIFRGEVPDAETLADLMFPDKVPAALGRPRAIVFTRAEAQPAPQSAEQAQSQAFGFLVNFAFDSARILPQSRAHLDQVGEMLKLDRLARQKIIIEGHTDATGSGHYNQRLSEQRAAAVRQYLMQHHGIEPDRLHMVGRGESDPLAEVALSDPLNRRVQFRRVP